ncbi:MAG: isoprenyl transferase [Streptosporangiales bacterium]|nr:isoprenyl transferase [Streptosporangiales bacterium]
MAVSDVLYRLYERRLERQLTPERVPRHVGVIVDGNRRWAKAYGESSSFGHRKGADKIEDLVGWCEEVGVEVVTVWLLSTENVGKRSQDELQTLFGIVEDVVNSIAGVGRWRVHPMGALDLLPDSMARLLKELADRTRDFTDLTVNVAIGYGGRQEITHAVRSLMQEHATRGTSLEELAETLDVEHIAEHLYTRGQPDPDLVIRTSGEQRLGGFLLWQSVYSEFYFYEGYWPAFRKVDFLRALRAYGQRERRFGK